MENEQDLHVFVNGQSASTTSFVAKQVEGSSHSPTKSPTTEFMKTLVIIGNQHIVFTQLFWLGLALLLLLIYLLVLRPCLPSLVVLRKHPNRRLRQTMRQGKAYQSKNALLCGLNKLKHLLIISIWEVLFLTEQQWISHCGMDSYITIRTMWFALRVMIGLCFLNVIVLTPTYKWATLSFGGPSQECQAYCERVQEYEYIDIDIYQADCVCGVVDQCSLANVPRGSSLLWFPAIMILLSSLFVLYRLDAEYKQIIRLRTKFYKRLFRGDCTGSLPGGTNDVDEVVRMRNDSREDAEFVRRTEQQAHQTQLLQRRCHHPSRLYTVFVERKCSKPAVNSESQTNDSGTFNQMSYDSIREFFERLFPNQVFRVDILLAKNTLHRLSSLGKRRAKVLRKLEHLSAKRALLTQQAAAQGSYPRYLLCSCCSNATVVSMDNTRVSANVANATKRKKEQLLERSCCGLTSHIDGLNNKIETYSSDLNDLNLSFQQELKEILIEEFNEEHRDNEYYNQNERALNMEQHRSDRQARYMEHHSDVTGHRRQERHGIWQVPSKVKEMVVKAYTKNDYEYQQAFVTFKNITSSTIASQVVLSAFIDQDEDFVKVQMAPDPSDVRWDSLGSVSDGRKRDSDVFWQRVMSYTLYTIVLLFWGSITSLIGAVTSAEALAKQYPSFNDYLQANPTSFIWIDRFLTLLYIIILSLAGPIISWSTNMDNISFHRISNSQMEHAILMRTFTFLVIQVFVFYSIAGAVFKTIVQILQNPPHIVATLSATIPKNAAFFIVYISTQTFNTILDLFRWNDLLLELLRLIVYGRSLTRRDFTYQTCGCCWNFKFPHPSGFAGTNAGILLVFFISISYSVIQPLVNVASLIFFAASILAYSFKAVYNDKQTYDGGGYFWDYSYWCVITSLFTAQLTLVGTLIIKQGYYEALFTFITSSGLTLFISLHMNDKYHTAATRMTLELARELDEATEPFKSSSQNGPSNKLIYEEICKPLSRYDQVLMYDSESEAEQAQEAQDDLEDQADTVKVYSYLHPVLLEKATVHVGQEIIIDKGQSRVHSRQSYLSGRRASSTIDENRSIALSNTEVVSNNAVQANIFEEHDGEEKQEAQEAGNFEEFQTDVYEP
jgi:hypothetical protein